MQRSRVTCRAAAVSVLGLLWVVTAAFACPETCDCGSDGEVDCSGRGLTVVPANIPLGTTVLRLDYNNIQNLSDADFSYLTSLEKLDLSNNDIRVLPAGVFSHLTSLQDLYLSDNHIADLPDGVFSHLTSLERLYLENNNISSLPTGVFSHLPRLKDLRLSRNHIADLPDGVFSDLTSLEGLHLDNNNILILPIGVFSHLTSLRWLALDDNHIANLPNGVFSNLTSLWGLELSNNNISSLPTGVFSHLASLQWLGLSDNHIANLPDGVFSNLTSLVQLYLHNNNISSLPTEVFSHLTRLRRLSIAGNPWRCDCNLYGLLNWARRRGLITDDSICSSPPHMERDALLFVTADHVCRGHGDCTTGSADGTCACNVRWTGPFCETEHNLALGKKASQSSTRAFNGVSAGAEKAVDGSRPIEPGNAECAVTNREHQPWWQVDLAGYYRVSRVRVINRFDVGTCGLSAFRHVPRTDCEGSDISSPPGVTLQGCVEACCADSTCLSFQYNIVNQCYLKSRLCSDGQKVSTSAGNMYDRIPIPGDTLMVRVGPNEDFTQNGHCGQTYDVGSAIEFPSIEADCDPPMYGRYVSVQAAPPVGVNTTGLVLCEVEVYVTDICCEYTRVMNGPIIAAKITATDGYCSGNDIQFSCDPGYELVGRSSATCQNNGSWDGEISTCKRACCNKTISITNGHVTASTGYCSGNSIQFSCDTGYDLVGSSFAVCQLNKDWDREISTCRRICCDNTIEIINGLVNATDGYCFGNEIQFSCNPGYELVGRSSATCEGDGSWGRELPTCRPHTGPTEQSLASTQAIIGGTSAGIVTALIVAAVCFVVFFRRRKKKRREEDPQPIELDFLPDIVAIHRRRMEEMVPPIPPRPQFPKLEVDPSRVTLGQRIGSGAFGLVYRATLTRDGRTEDVVVKTVKENACEDDKLGFLEEIRAVVDLGVHKNLLGMINCCTVVRDHLYLITEFMPYGDLKSFLRKCREEENSDEPRDDIYNFEVMQMYQVARQIARGMVSTRTCRWPGRSLEAW